MKRFLVFLGILAVLCGAIFFISRYLSLRSAGFPDEPTTWEEWIKAYSPSYVTQQKGAEFGTREMDAKWENWIDEQTEMLYDFVLEKATTSEMRAGWEPYMTPATFEAALREELRAQVVAKAEELRQESSTPPLEQVQYSFRSEISLGIIPSQRHEGPQTPEALMASFDERYSRQSRNSSGFDEKYPRAEWLQMYVDNGWPLEDFDDYTAALNLRADVGRAENDPSQWTSGLLDIPPTEDWETYKTAFIAAQVRMTQRAHAAMDADPEVGGGYSPYSRPDVFLPFKGDSVYVRRNGLATSYYGIGLTSEQKFNLTHRGIHPEGIEIIYVDNDYNILSERPPLITQEMLAEIPLPPEGWQPPPGWIPPVGLEEELRAQGWTGSFAPQEEAQQQQPDPHPMDDVPKEFVQQAETDVEAVQAETEFENVQRELERFMEMTDAEIEAELEKLLTPEIPEFASEESVETDFRERFDPGRFSPERISRALETLNRYGREVGLRRLQLDDPEIAEQMKQTLFPNTLPEGPPPAEEGPPRD